MTMDGLEQALLAAGDRGAAAQDLAYTLHQTPDRTRRQLLAAPWAQQAKATHHKARRWFHQNHAAARLAYEAALRAPRGKPQRVSATTEAHIIAIIHAAGPAGMNRRELHAASGCCASALQDALPRLAAKKALVEGVDDHARGVTGKRYWTPQHAPANPRRLRKLPTPRKPGLRPVQRMSPAATSVEQEPVSGAAIVTVVKGHRARFERLADDPPPPRVFGGQIGRYLDNDSAIARAYGPRNPCTCHTPSGRRHCPEHCDDSATPHLATTEPDHQHAPAPNSPLDPATHKG